MKCTLLNYQIKRFLIMLLGNALLGVGVTCLRLSDFGTDPFACMNIGVSSHLPISYGTYQMLFNGVLFIFVIFLFPKSFGIGAFINMVGLGYEIDLLMWLCDSMGVTIEGVAGLYALRVILLILGVVIISTGIALYVHCNMGIAPYDAIGVVVEQRTHGKISFRVTRIVLDVLALLVGFLTGGPLGIGTFLVGFCTGPLVSWIKTNLAEKWLPSQN